MRKHTMIAAISAALALAALAFASAAHATGAVRGTRELITFEGICGKEKQKDVKGGYDGFVWSNILATGKDAEPGFEGFAAVIHGNVATTFAGQHGSFYVSSGTFTLRSGHFAAFASSPEQLTIAAYRKGVKVGELDQTLQPVDTVIKFDSTFSHIDTVMITASGDGINVAMDNLVVSF